MIIDGDIQANLTMNKKMLGKTYPISDLAGHQVNTLIFPNLSSGNITYKLLMEIGASEAIDPILMSMKKPLHVLQVGSSVREIYNMTAVAVIDAEATANKRK